MKYLFSAIISLAILSSSCSDPLNHVALDHKETNSVYYWKTVFKPDSFELSFLRNYDVGRIYLRMFDVSVDPLGGNTLENSVIPNATVRFANDYCYSIHDSIGDIEFVPVVYITLDALKKAKGQEGLLVKNIVTRVRNMCLYNDLPNIGELQLDCDWTASTEDSFFALCDRAKQIIRELQLPWKLSSTVRLHQLSRKVPPVDNGVLMVYNTGCFNNPDADNSIIDVKDVEPYLKHLRRYPLHLDVAYPTYSWQLLFRKRKFIGLINGVDVTNTSQFAVCGKNRYVALRDVPYRDKIIRAGDIIRQETSKACDILKIKKLIDARLAGRQHSNILYHLDSKNLSKYSSDEIDNIFDSNR